MKQMMTVDTLTTDEKETYFEEEDDLFEEDDDEVNQSETADYRNDDVAPLGPWTKAQKSRVEPRDEMKAFVGWALFSLGGGSLRAARAQTSICCTDHGPIERRAHAHDSQLIMPCTHK